MTAELAGGGDRWAESPSQEAIPEGWGGACAGAGSIVGRAAVVTAGDATGDGVSHGARDGAGGSAVERLVAGDSAGQPLGAAGAAAVGAAGADENLDSGRLANRSEATAGGAALENTLPVAGVAGAGAEAGAAMVAAGAGAAEATGWLGTAGVVAMAGAG